MPLLLSDSGRPSHALHQRRPDLQSLTGVKPATGIIKIVSSSSIDPKAIKPLPSIRAWGTHILVTGVTETGFQGATLSRAEIGSLQAGCSGVFLFYGGICSCGSGS